MALRGLFGKPKDINSFLLKYAIDHQPSLILDCGNCANPHALFPFALPENVHDVFVVEIEAIYKFREALKAAPRTAKDVGARTIVITAFHHLINYQDEEENNNLLDSAWQHMKTLSLTYDVLVGVDPSQQKRAHDHGTHRLEPTNHA